MSVMLGKWLAKIQQAIDREHLKTQERAIQQRTSEAAGITLIKGELSQQKKPRETRWA